MIKKNITLTLLLIERNIVEVVDEITTRGEGSDINSSVSC